jgi:GT2 family glycosyltransferase
MFDLAYERGPRADRDLGMRLYLAGKQLVLDPSISVIHHRAPRGGLREHKARVTTYAGSRQKLLERHELAATEVYLWLRYFSDEQVKEAFLLRLLGTLSRHGSKRQRLARLGVQLALLPGTWRQMTDSRQRAREMLASYPQIPSLRQPDQAADAR